MNWYDAAAPSSATVVLDDVPHTMTLIRGSSTNGAYKYPATGVSTACVLAVDLAELRAAVLTIW